MYRSREDYRTLARLGVLDAFDQLRIGADAEIARIARMQRIEHMRAAESRAHRQ